MHKKTGYMQKPDICRQMDWYFSRQMEPRVDTKAGISFLCQVQELFSPTFSFLFLFTYSPDQSNDNLSLPQLLSSVLENVGQNYYRVFFSLGQTSPILSRFFFTRVKTEEAEAKKRTFSSSEKKFGEICKFAVVLFPGSLQIFNVLSWRKVDVRANCVFNYFSNIFPHFRKIDL